MKFEIGSRLLHLNSRKEYFILVGPDQAILEATDEPAYIYSDGQEPADVIWVRSQKEMEDGRFELIKADNE